MESGELSLPTTSPALNCQQPRYYPSPRPPWLILTSAWHLMSACRHARLHGFAQAPRSLQWPTPSLAPASCQHAVHLLPNQTYATPLQQLPTKNMVVVWYRCLQRLTRAFARSPSSHPETAQSVALQCTVVSLALARSSETQNHFPDRLCARLVAVSQQHCSLVTQLCALGTDASRVLT
jgi:hypothetical protein